MKKNDEYTIQIEDVGNDGEGIGHITLEDGGKLAVFVKDTVIGDEAQIGITKVKKNYAFGRLIKLITPSPSRVTPACENARRCGGCSLMHMAYEEQLRYKWNKVKNCLERIGELDGAASLMEPIYGMEHPYHYRNKMQFPVGVDKEGNVQLGFYAGRTHSLIDLDCCAIGHPIHDELLCEIKAYLNKYQKKTGKFIYNEIAHKGFVRHILTRVGFTTKELMVCMIANGNSLDKIDQNATQDFILAIEKAVKSYNIRCKDTICLKSVCLNINTEKTNRILGDRCKTLYGQSYITDYIGDVKFEISPMSFYQVNPVSTKVLYDKALEYANLTGEEIVWDMYCGIGTISLFLAQQAKKVYGVEIIPQAIEDAKRNATNNQLTNTEFFCGKAEEIVPAFYEKEKIGTDVVVVDPPRKGCEESLLLTIDKMNPKRFVYVSCDPATLARDIKIMTNLGWKVEKVAVVDQFGHSTHVETCVLITRDKKGQNS